jgi:ribosomal protein L21E
MGNKKSIRTRGKVSLSKYFQEFNEGDNAAVIKEASIPSNFPKNIQGRTGVIEAKRGKAYIVKINDKNQEKRYIIEAIHLKKIENFKRKVK